MFRGRYFNVMDDKGRITIPPRYRDILKVRQEQQLIVTNLDGYLIAFPSSEWEIIEQKFSRTSDFRQGFKVIYQVFCFWSV